MAVEAKVHSPIHPTSEALVVQHAVGLVMKKNWVHSVDRCWLQALQFVVHLIDLLSILLRCNGFPGIQKVVVDQTGSRPPNSDHNLFFGANLALELLLSKTVMPDVQIPEREERRLPRQ